MPKGGERGSATLAVDDQFIYLFTNGVLVKINKTSMKVAGKVDLRRELRGEAGDRSGSRRHEENGFGDRERQPSRSRNRDRESRRERKRDEDEGPSREPEDWGPGSDDQDR